MLPYSFFLFCFSANFLSPISPTALRFLLFTLALLAAMLQAKGNNKYKRKQGVSRTLPPIFANQWLRAKVGRRLVINYKFCQNEHVEIGKQSSLKQKWELSLKSSSLFVRNLVSKIVYLFFMLSCLFSPSFCLLYLYLQHCCKQGKGPALLFSLAFAKQWLRTKEIRSWLRRPVQALSLLPLLTLLPLPSTLTCFIFFLIKKKPKGRAGA